MDKPPIPAPRPVPGPGEGKRGAEGYLGYLLRQAAAASRLATERALVDLGATPPQFMVLTILEAYPGASGADIARVAHLTPQTVNLILRNLERAGAVAKSAHPVHGRVLQVSLTESGRIVLAACKSRLVAVDDQLSHDLSPADDAVIRNWLVRVAVEMGQ